MLLTDCMCCLRIDQSSTIKSRFMITLRELVNLSLGEIHYATVILPKESWFHFFVSATTWDDDCHLISYIVANHGCLDDSCTKSWVWGKRYLPLFSSNFRRRMVICLWPMLTNDRINPIYKFDRWGIGNVCQGKLLWVSLWRHRIESLRVVCESTLSDLQAWHCIYIF